MTEKNTRPSIWNQQNNEAPLDLTQLSAQRRLEDSRIQPSVLLSIDLNIFPPSTGLTKSQTIDEAWNKLMEKHIPNRGETGSVIPATPVEGYLEQYYKPDVVLVEGFPVYRGIRDDVNTTPTATGNEIADNEFYTAISGVCRDIGALEDVRSARQQLLLNLENQIIIQAQANQIILNTNQLTEAKTLLFEQTANVNYRDLRLIDGSNMLAISQHSDSTVREVATLVYRSLECC